MLRAAALPFGGVDDRAVSLARQATNAAAASFAAWSAVPPRKRAEHLVAAAATLDLARKRLKEAAAEEVGAAPDWTDFNTDLAVSALKQAASLAPLLTDRRIDDPAKQTRSILRREAAGVVVGVASWNAPVMLGVRAIAAPLICGNTVVMKGSEHCPRTHEILIEAVNASGFPQGVVGVVNNLPNQSPAVVSALIAHPAVRRINFTGSTRVGREVAIEAARHLKPCLLELSGKAPLIVLEDADLDAAAEAAAFGAFFNQGQICMSTERIVVLDAVADAFVDKLVAITQRLRAADPALGSGELGRLISEAAARRVSALISDAVSKGAILACGGEASGPVLQPAVLDRVSSNMAIFHEESFGPVASVLRVRDEEEALSIANDSAYGLAAAIFSADEARALKLAGQIESGIVQINGPTVYDNPAMPFGGMKASGYGRFGGEAAIDQFTELRWICLHDRPLRQPFGEA